MGMGGINKTQHQKKNGAFKLVKYGGMIGEVFGARIREKMAWLATIF